MDELRLQSFLWGHHEGGFGCSCEDTAEEVVSPSRFFEMVRLEVVVCGESN